MTDEGPEFHTRAVTPLSPLPVHPPEPSNIPVLCNQIDPIFNMTSTHIAPATESHTLPAMDTAPDTIDVDVSVPDDGSDTSDPFAEEQDKNADDSTTKEAANATDEVNDDYAMTFDSDGEGEAVEDVMEETPKPVVDESAPTSASISIATATVSSIAPITPMPTTESQHLSPEGSAATLTTSVAELESTAITQNGKSGEFNNTQAPVPILPQTQAQRNESNGNDQIDIQQLLDNITANASNVTVNNATSPITPTSAFPAGGLSAHSSLPPRPPTQQKPSVQSSGYPGAPPSYTYGPPGVSLVAAGAPGTSTDHRNVLPPPPSASFGSPPGLANPPSAYSQVTRNQAPPLGRARPDHLDDADTPWGPEIQKIYDTFLTEERGYVTEGLWDRFPKGSRLFIGMKSMHGERQVY